MTHQTQPRTPSADTGGLRLTGLVKRFGERVILDGFDLDLAEGSFVSLLAPSGAGKSTVLNLVAGFLALDAGSIRLGDREISTVPAHRREIGFIFQDFALFPHLTVAQNIAFPLRRRRVGKGEVRRRVNEVLDMVGLGDFCEARPASLSGGQRQRVAIARAVVYQPRTLLMDEPMSSLDRGLRDDMTAEIKRLQVGLGVSVLYVTHDQQEALTLSDQIGVLQGGKLAQLDTPAAIYSSPTTQTIAKLTGPVCLAPVRNATASRGTTLVTLDTDDAPLHTTVGLPDGSQLLAGTRPHLVRFEERPDDNQVSGCVTGLGLTGSGVQYRVALDDGTAWVVLRPEPAPGVGVGDRVPLYFSPGDTIVVTA